MGEVKINTVKGVQEWIHDWRSKQLYISHDEQQLLQKLEGLLEYE